MARSAAEAVEKEKEVSPDEVWIDEKWMEKNDSPEHPISGFTPRL